MIEHYILTKIFITLFIIKENKKTLQLTEFEKNSLGSGSSYINMILWVTWIEK